MVADSDGLKQCSEWKYRLFHGLSFWRFRRRNHSTRVVPARWMYDCFKGQLAKARGAGCLVSGSETSTVSSPIARSKTSGLLKRTWLKPANSEGSAHQMNEETLS